MRDKYSYSDKSRRALFFDGLKTERKNRRTHVGDIIGHPLDKLIHPSNTGLSIVWVWI
jgi:hypothetical protein